MSTALKDKPGESNSEADTGVWHPWIDQIQGDELICGTNKKLQEMLVPTMDTVRYTYLMDLCIRYLR